MFMPQHLPEYNHIHNWLNQHEKPNLGTEEADVERLIEVSAQLEVPVNRAKGEVWQALENQISHTPKRSFIAYHPLRIAAIVIVLCGIGLGIFLQKTTEFTQIQSARAEHKEVRLPDGSTVLLNAASTVTYDAANWDEERKIELQGEAFFNVKKGESFEVNTAHGSVKVLGTSFDVYARKAILKVSVFSGEVAVRLPSKEVTHLLPGQALSFEQGHPVSDLIQQFDQQTTGSWKKGEFHFDSVPLIDVIAEIERQYDVIFEWEQGLEKRPYDGFFTINDLEKTLKTIFDPLGISYEMMDNGHILLR